MNFLLDANLPYSTKEVFPKAYNIFHVRDIGLSDATDEVILSWAKEHRAVVVTRDFDFANILRFPPQEHFGVVVLKLVSGSNTMNIKEVLGAFIQSIEAPLLTKAVVIVEDGRYRIRR